MRVFLPKVRVMRLIATADLHYNHLRSKPLAQEVIEQINRAGGDVLLVVGDTATGDGDALEQCLARFRFAGPKLFVAGNHELWTLGDDSEALIHEALPRRVRALGWQWLQTDPFVAGDLAIVGSVGWYDFSFAQENLGIPLRFYRHKISPGAARGLSSMAHLFDRTDDLTDFARSIVARWNDGRFVHLAQSDEAFLQTLLDRLASQLDALMEMKTIVAAIHHLPFAELLPPPHRPQWDFAKAYLGSARIGELLLKHPNVRYALCGHSHMAVEAKIRHLHAVNIGSSYRWKTFRTFDL